MFVTVFDGYTVCASLNHSLIYGLCDDLGLFNMATSNDFLDYRTHVKGNVTLAVVTGVECTTVRNK